MPPEGNLLSLQRRFMTALREPIFGDSRARSALPDRTGAVSAKFIETAEELITPSVSMSSMERLELYHRQYWYRLLDSMAEDFPALRQLLGDSTFWQLIEAYLEATPPRSFTLRHLGADLAEFVASHPWLVPHPAHAEDLAHLEYVLCAAFEAGERTPIAPSRISEVPVSVQPHVHLLALRTPAEILWRRAIDGRPLGALRRPSEQPARFVIVSREALRLRVERLPKAAFSILQALEQTSSLELAMTRVSSVKRLLRRRDATRVTEWFKAWMSRGWLCEAGSDLPAKAMERNRP